MIDTTFKVCTFRSTNRKVPIIVQEKVTREKVLCRLDQKGAEAKQSHYYLC